MVFLQAEMCWNVLISAGQLSPKGLLLRKSIIVRSSGASIRQRPSTPQAKALPAWGLKPPLIVRLLEDVTNRKASKEHGYYIAVNGLKEISEGRIRELTGDVLFPVTFTCITQRPMKGEILVGSVEKILKHGVFLKSGPMENIFMSAKSMSDYKYMGGDNPMFMKDYSKLEKYTIVRFKVMGFCWMEADRQFRLLATMAGDFLGPL